MAAVFNGFRNETFADEWVDPAEWMVKSSLGEFLLMPTNGIKYMCMFAYTYYHGCKLFGTPLKEDSSIWYKFVRMIFQCTGGGLLVPIFINAIPVSLGNDAYPIAIFASLLFHVYAPILREVVKLSPLLKSGLIFLYETQRASVVVKLTTAAAAAIAPTEFSIPLFGPIFCGTVAGCGGAFLPLDKGLAPIENGLATNMTSAFFAATFYHIFVNTSLSDGVPDAAKKAQVAVALFFISYSLHTDIGFAKLLNLDTKVSTVKEEVKEAKLVSSEVVSKPEEPSKAVEAETKSSPSKSKKSKKSKKAAKEE